MKSSFNVWKIKMTTIVFFSIVINYTYSQGCLPNGITFTTQQQIDDFPTDYPGCTVIEGDVIIKDGVNQDIVNISGLNNIQEINGVLDIGPTLVVSLNGFSNLEKLSGRLRLCGNQLMTTVNSFALIDTIEGNFELKNNPALNVINDFNNMNHLEGDIEVISTNLMNLDFLSNIESINGRIFIRNNSVLEDIYGLENIDSESINDIQIEYNSTLSTCNINSICNYLALPMHDIDVDNNADGCDSNLEIYESCGICPPWMTEYPFPNIDHEEIDPNSTKLFENPCNKNLEITSLDPLITFSTDNINFSSSITTTEDFYMQSGTEAVLVDLEVTNLELGITETKQVLICPWPLDIPSFMETNDTIDVYFCEAMEFISWDLENTPPPIVFSQDPYLSYSQILSTHISPVKFASTNIPSDEVNIQVTNTVTNETTLHTIQVGSALPLLYKDELSVISKNNHSTLTWSTIQEINNSYFEIQHSSDGHSYTKIGEIIGQGKSNTEVDYEYIHYSPSIGINYYRLKQVDLDGQYEYSKVVSVIISNKKNGIQVYPNPAIDKVFIESKGISAYKIYDIYGNESIKGELQEGINEVDISEMEKGIYTIITQDGVSDRIIKL